MAKFYWHIHHDKLVEPLIEPIKKRIQFIRDNKPAHELDTRLRLMRPVRGKLPKAMIEADAVRVKADAAWDEAYAAWDEAVKDNLPAIEALHRKECPNCPWDGKSIFPKKEE